MIKGPDYKIWWWQLLHIVSLRCPLAIPFILFPEEEQQHRESVGVEPEAEVYVRSVVIHTDNQWKVIWVAILAIRKRRAEVLHVWHVSDSEFNVQWTRTGIKSMIRPSSHIPCFNYIMCVANAQLGIIHCRRLSVGWGGNEHSTLFINKGMSSARKDPHLSAQIDYVGPYLGRIVVGVAVGIMLPPPPYAKLKIYKATLLTAGIIIISTPVSAIV